MLVYENQTNNLLKTYSDQNYYIMYNGYYYNEVIVAPAEKTKVIETDIVLPSPIATPEYFLSIFSPDLINITQEQVREAYTVVFDAFKAIKDTDVYKVRFLLKKWERNVAYEAGEKVVFNTNVYDVRQNHVSDLLPSLDETNYYLIEKPIDLIEPWSIGTTYNIGEKTRVGNNLYISKLNNNTWSPISFPAAWTIVK